MGMAITLKKLLLNRAFEATEGKLKLFGGMNWTMYPSRGLAAMLQEYGKKAGKKELFDMGLENGRENGNEMMATMKLKPSGGWLTINAVKELMDFLGYGQISFVKFEAKKNGHHHIIMHAKDNPAVEHAKVLYGKNSLACLFFQGLFSGHGEVEFGLKNVRLKETRCICKGNNCCIYESKW